MLHAVVVKKYTKEPIRIIALIMFHGTIGGLGQGLSIGGVARGGLFLFISSVVASVLGYVYWLLVSIFSTAEVVGIASSVDSLSSLVAGIAILGVPTGVARFLGRDSRHKNARSLNTYFWSSFTFTLTLCIFSTLIIWVLALLNISFMGFSESMLLSVGLLVFLNFSGIMSVLLVSMIKTEYLVVSNVITAAAKLSLGVLLVYLGFGWVGAVTGIILANLFMAVLLLFFALVELRHLGAIEIRFSFRALRESLYTGFATWLPGVIALFGQQLGLITVFGLQGGSEAGTYFMAYAVFSILYMIPSSLMSILFPILSGLGKRDGIDVASKTLKMCLALASPLTVFLILYSEFPLSLIGSDYTKAAPTLSLLASSTIPLTFVLIVSSFVYARGLYGKVIGIGVAMNVPRVILYFLLVPIYGGFGAALSYFIGSITGLVATMYVIKKSDFQVSLRKITIAIIIPFAAALPCLLMELNWFVGGTVILLASIFCYGRAGVMERSNLAEIARAFASEKTIAKASERLNWLLKIIYGE